MKPVELKEAIEKYPSNNKIALVENWTNNHIYDIQAGYIHISGDDNYLEISFTISMKFIFKYLWVRFRRLFKMESD